MKDVFLSDPKWKRDNNQFRPGFYNFCEKKILLAFAGTNLRASPHIESKIKLWRKQYSTLYDMVNASGFGWDDYEKMVLVDSDDVWSNYVKRVPDAKGMRNKPFPYYEDWLILFGNDKATGELAEGPAESVAAMENEEAIGEKGDQSLVEKFWFNELTLTIQCHLQVIQPTLLTRLKLGQNESDLLRGFPKDCLRWLLLLEHSLKILTVG
ncbi:hypothetical protein ACSBR2_022172 [Camellia fascicularis]